MIYNFLRSLCFSALSSQPNLVNSRSAFIPYSSEEKCGLIDTVSLHNSDRITVLDGKWKLSLFPLPIDNFDDSTAIWTEINVPSCLQTEGLDIDNKNKKTNGVSRYSCVFKTHFDINNIKNKHFLTFDKVSGSLEIFVNGNNIGYSTTCSGCFDVSSNVVLGENELVAVINNFPLPNEFTNEKQRNVSGILGSVYITERTDCYLVDYAFSAETFDTQTKGVLSLELSDALDAEVIVELFDGKTIKYAHKKQIKDGIVEFTISGAYETYSPENPYLYDLYINVVKNDKVCECVPIKVGFCQVSAVDGKILTNGVPFKFKGVDYRSLINSNGSLMQETDFREELSIIKSFNINTVAIESNYPPCFYDICDELGIFVIRKFPEITIKNSKKTAETYKNAEIFLSNKMNVEFSAISNHVCACTYDLLDKVNNISAPSFVKLQDALSCENRPVFITDFVIGKTETINRFEEYMTLLSAQENFAGIIVKEFKKLVDEVVNQALFDENNVAYDEGILYKYVNRPLKARIIDNKHFEIVNTRSFLGTDDIKITLYLIKGDFDKEIASFTPVIAPGGAMNYELFLGDVEPNMRALVKQSNKYNNAHIASEYIKLVSGDVICDSIADLCCKRYKYTVKNRIFTLKKLSENILEERSYFVPNSSMAVSKKALDVYEERRVSDRVFSLAGPWDFFYAKSNAPLEFNSDGLIWDKINVPASWESEGKEKFAFVSGYPFKANLKRFEIVSEREDSFNSTGIYRKIINIGDTSFDYVLSFMKVNGSIELHVNGEYVGYSMIGKAEFDVSNHIVLGENEIVVVVKKWTPASFLDGGDGFLATGIIGEVNLLKLRKGSLFDYEIVVDKQGADYIADVTLLFKESGNKVKIELEKDNVVVFNKIADVVDNVVSFGISGRFIGYSTEKPELYDMYVKVLENGAVTECTKIKVGFSHLFISSDVAYYNDIPIKLRGVTYNPTYNDAGTLLTADDIKKDIALIKEYGFNIIQPLHYVDAEFVRYCQEVGLFVLPRLGINTKGCEKINPKMRNAVVNCNKFEELIKTVVSYEYSRDKSCVNIPFYQFVEDAKTHCIRSSMEMLKSWTDKPILAYGNGGDAISACYPTVSGVLDLINEALDKKPVFFTKYASARGIGCATMHEYEDLIVNTPCCMGGCVAHFVDDYVKDLGVKAMGIFTYDRKPYPSAESIKYLYRPIRSEINDDKTEIEIFNLNKFASTDNYKIVLNVITNGHTVTKSEINAKIAPSDSRVYDLVLGHVEGDTYLNVECYSKSNNRLLCVEQHVLNVEIPQLECEIGEKELEIREFYDDVDITFDCGHVRFNKKLGCITRYSLLGKDILKPISNVKGEGSVKSNVYRPFIRNMSENFPTYKNVVRDFVCDFDEVNGKKQLHVNVETVLMMGKKEHYVIQDKYIVSASGSIEVFSVINPMRRGLPVMDCFGKQFRLHNAFGNVVYYGNGGGDNYIDMREHTRIGIYETSVDKTFALLDTLQEDGNRTQVSYAMVKDGDDDGLMFITNREPFQLRVSPYSDKEIYNGFHTGVRPQQSGVYVDINAFVSGIGTSNDGKPLPQYVYRSGEYILHFTLIPIKG